MRFLHLQLANRPIIDHYRGPVAKIPLTMPHKLLLLVVAALTLPACLQVSTRFVPLTTAEERAAAAKLPVHEERLAPGTYEALGDVRGLSCQMRSKDAYQASSEGALAELKRATVRQGGTAVMGVRCAPLVRGQNRTNCFRAFECTGTAVVLDRRD